MNFKNAVLKASRTRSNHAESVKHSVVSRKRGYTSLLLIGAFAAIIAFALLPAEQSAAKPTFTGGACSDTYSGCHDGVQTVSMMTITGMPTGSYIPGQPYSIKITIADTNGVDTGQNAFDLIINAGALSSTDANVEIVNPSIEAKANTAIDLKRATTFNVTWTAPLSGSVNIEVWAVMGDGAGSTHDIWDREAFSYSTVPEFPAILIPIIGISCAVILASRLSKKK